MVHVVGGPGVPILAEPAEELAHHAPSIERELRHPLLLRKS